jgi:hypothetical protein
VIVLVSIFISQRYPTYFTLLFPTVKEPNVLFLTNLGWATFWTILFTSSSGHPDPEQQNGGKLDCGIFRSLKNLVNGPHRS